MNTSYGRNLPLLGIVLSVAALVVTASLLQTLTDLRTKNHHPQAQQAFAPATVDPTLDIDLGQVTSSEVVAGCLVPGFATSPSQVRVLYGVQQRQVSGSGPVFVLRNKAGEVRLCDEFGADRPSQAPLPTVSDSRTVEFLSNGRSSWKCAGSTQVLDELQMTSWLLVSPDIATVQQRYFVEDKPGPWFTTRAQNGFAHLQSWLVGPEPAGTKFAVQYRALDASGDDVPQGALPTGRHALSGCAAGSAEIG